MKRMFSCSSSQVAMESWTRQDQKLLDAVARGDVARVAALAARRSARPAKLNARGQSALHVAAAGGLTECLTLLLHHGAPVNERNDDGSTALHLATIACQPQCVKVLLQHGANERHVDGQNRTPLHWAASSGCASSVVLLCDHEAPLDVPDAHGQTPLMLAAQGNHAAVCAQLLQHGAEPRLADSHGRTALALAQAHRSLEAAELLQSHMGDKDTGNVTGKAPNLTLRRVPHCGGRENSAGVVGIQEREEEEEEENGHTARQLQEELERKSQECQRLEGAASSLRRRLRELVQLLPGRDEDEDRACLDLLAQHLATLRKRMRDEEQEGEHGDAKAPALIPFLAWLGEECAKMREAKASTFSQSREWRWKAKDSPGDQGTWERLVEGLEQQLELQDQTHTRMLQESQILLEKLRREATTTCRCAVNGAGMDLDRKSQEETPREGGRMEERMEKESMKKEKMEKESMKKERMEKERMELAPGGKSCEETPRKGERMEKELLELREGNGKLLVELARLGRERERLQEELRELGKRDEARRLQRELEVLRDRVGARVRDSGGDASAGILRDLHCRLDALVRSQHEALQLITDMEGDSGGAPRGSGEGAIRAEPGAAESPDGPPASEREAAESRERELREKAERLELSLQALREKAARLERACRDKDGKLKQLLVETEKLSAEVLGLRGRSARLQLQLEVQQKQHRDTVAVYRTHLLRAAQGFMDQGVHAALLQILQDQAGAGPCH